eukprot:TRINITY_DN4211_c0_g1_i1.p1 TRINITY_DN4211_c0_g1~~TRINITY_DN4211_c0_g1_i1.p1  ORF type:complete len:560 (-),score=97.67 TRINITY_DN4211_c0_g1_i1:1449-3080(-)
MRRRSLVLCSYGRNFFLWGNRRGRNAHFQRGFYTNCLMCSNITVHRTAYGTQHIRKDIFINMRTYRTASSGPKKTPKKKKAPKRKTARNIRASQEKRQQYEAQSVVGDDIANIEMEKTRRNRWKYKHDEYPPDRIKWLESAKFVNPYHLYSVFFQIRKARYTLMEALRRLRGTSNQKLQTDKEEEEWVDVATLEPVQKPAWLVRQEAEEKRLAEEEKRLSEAATEEPDAELLADHQFKTVEEVREEMRFLNSLIQRCIVLLPKLDKGDTNFWNEVINELKFIGNIEEGRKVLAIMKVKGISRTEIPYNSLLETCLRIGGKEMFYEGLRLFKELKEDAFISSEDKRAIEKRKLEREDARKVFASKVAKIKRRSTSAFKVSIPEPEQEDWDAELQRYTKAVKPTFRTYELLFELGISANLDSTELVLLGKLYKDMRLEGVAPSKFLIKTSLDIFIKAKDLDGVFGCLGDYKQLLRDENAVHVRQDSHMQAAEEAEFRKVAELSLNKFLSHCKNSPQTPEILRAMTTVMAAMKKSNIAHPENFSDI